MKVEIYDTKNYLYSLKSTSLFHDGINNSRSVSAEIEELFILCAKVWYLLNPVIASLVS
jgi:hypothetical protein